MLFKYYCRYFSHYSWYVKGFSLFQTIICGIHWIFKNGRNLGNYVDNPPI